MSSRRRSLSALEDQICTMSRVEPLILFGADMSYKFRQSSKRSVLLAYLIILLSVNSDMPVKSLKVMLSVIRDSLNKDDENSTCQAVQYRTAGGHKLPFASFQSEKNGNIGLSSIGTCQAASKLRRCRHWCNFWSVSIELVLISRRKSQLITSTVRAASD